MFSFIKWFGSLIENAKKKKGLWFTLLTSFSLVGIFISLYFVNFLVSDVAQKTYENHKNHYVLSFKNKLMTENEYTEAIALSLSKNEDIAKEFFTPDENATKRIETKSQAISGKINNALGKESLNISFIEVKKATLEYIPNTTIELSDEHMEELDTLIDKLDEDEDVQTVYTNIE